MKTILKFQPTSVNCLGENLFCLRGKKRGDFSPSLAFFHRFPEIWLIYEEIKNCVCLVWYSGSLVLNFSILSLPVLEIEAKEQCLPAIHFWPSFSFFSPFSSQREERLLKKNPKSSVCSAFILYTWFSKGCPYRRKCLSKEFGQIRSPSL